jgi:hypothetical protein
VGLGIISDTLEDNRERTGQLLSVLTLNWVGQAPQRRQVLPCPICGDLLLDDSTLQQHILKRHRHLQVYIRLNGTVLPEVALIDQPITQLMAVVLGDSFGTVQFAIDDRELFDIRIAPGRPLAFEKHVPKGFRGKIDVRIRIGLAERSFMIYCGTQPVLDVAQLDESIWDLQSPLLGGAEPNWSKFGAQRLSNRFENYLQKRYLEGFYSYILGCYLETQGSPHAGKHLEEAIGKLRPFSTTMAHTARCVLALKLNAFRLLKDCGPESRFYGANKFFNGSATKSVVKRPHTSVVGRGLWIDTFLEGLLTAISDFNAKEFTQVEDKVAELMKSPYSKEPNNHEKVTLLQARTAAIQGNIEVARRAYLRLVHSSLFGEEAQKHCE